LAGPHGGRCPSRDQSRNLVRRCHQSWSLASLTSKLPAVGDRPTQVPGSCRPGHAATPGAYCLTSPMVAGTRAGVITRQGTHTGGLRAAAHARTCGWSLPRLGREPPRRGSAARSLPRQRTWWPGAYRAEGQSLGLSPAPGWPGT
jgi:hypothetical protein